MSLESEVREPTLRDNFTDGEPPEFTVQPGMYIAIDDREGVANYTGSEIRVSVKQLNGRRLIGFHV